MAKQKLQFKPHVGRLFEFKNYAHLKSFPPVILVMDETNDRVMFLDGSGKPVWVAKGYLRAKPLETENFAATDTVTNAMSLIEDMRKILVEYFKDEGKSKLLNKRCSDMLLKLRQVATAMEWKKIPTDTSETNSD